MAEVTILGEVNSNGRQESITYDTATLTDSLSYCTEAFWTTARKALVRTLSWIEYEMDRRQKEKEEAALTLAERVVALEINVASLNREKKKRGKR